MGTFRRAIHIRIRGETYAVRFNPGDERVVSAVLATWADNPELGIQWPDLEMIFSALLQRGQTGGIRLIGIVV